MSRNGGMGAAKTEHTAINKLFAGIVKAEQWFYLLVCCRFDGIMFEC